jgi:hypothetical protein
MLLRVSSSYTRSIAIVGFKRFKQMKFKKLLKVGKWESYPMKQIAEETSYEAEQSIRKNHNLIVM